MKRWSAILPVLLLTFFSCSKIFNFSETPKAEKELVAQYRAQARPLVSASFSAVASQGVFKGELYLEPGATVQALVFGYLPIGQGLFELKLAGDSFLTLDFVNSYAYSNNPDWLKNYVSGGDLDSSEQLALSLMQALKALTGGLDEPLTYSSASGQLIATSGADGREVKYYFNTSPLRLAKIEFKKQEIELTVRLVYSTECWFPSELNLKEGKTWANIKMDPLNCAETKRPEMNFPIPAGFSRILISAP